MLLPMIEISHKLTVAQALEAANQYFVYGWWQRERYLYIGMTTRGYNRLLHHDVLGKKADYEPEDEIHIWNCKDAAQALSLESRLIFEHKPIFNKLIKDVRCYEERLNECKHCKKKFLPTREWHMFCSPECRSGFLKVKRDSHKVVERVCVPPGGCGQTFMLPAQDFNIEQSFLCPSCRALNQTKT